MINNLNSKGNKKIATNPNKIRGLMYLKGFSVGKMARTIGVSEVYISYVIHGRRYGASVRRAIAEALCVKYEALWGKEPMPRKAA